MKKAKKCEVCGTTEGRIWGKKGKYKVDLCNKHYGQMHRLGHVLTKTKFDPSEIMIDGDILRISLCDSNGIKVDETIVSLRHFDKVKDLKWYFDGHNYAITTIDGKSVYLHRYIMDYPLDMVVDHRNHCTLDNTDDNLRICTKQENNCNTIVRTDNTSGYKGVSWDKDRNKWVASIQVNRKQMYLGLFTDINDAIAARKDAEIKYFGEFRYQEIPVPSMSTRYKQEVSA